MNSVVLIGRLTKDPEVRYIPQSETAVANFTIAVDRPMAKEKTADFLRIVAFGKTAELCERFLVKGLLVAVQGRIQTGQYKDKNGETRYTTEVVAERVEFIEWAKKDDGPSKEGRKDYTRERGQVSQESADVPAGFQAMEDDDDDIPF